MSTRRQTFLTEQDIAGSLKGSNWLDGVTALIGLMNLWWGGGRQTPRIYPIVKTRGTRHPKNLTAEELQLAVEFFTITKNDKMLGLVEKELGKRE